MALKEESKAHEKRKKAIYLLQRLLKYLEQQPANA